MSTQFKIRMDEDLAAALDTASRNHGKRSAQIVAIEVLRDYLPFWEQAEQIKRNAIEKQREKLFNGKETIWAEKGAPLPGKKKASSKKKKAS